MEKIANNKKFQALIENTTVNVNGEIQKAADAKISVFDRGFLYGDSIYEVTYSENGSLIFFNEHLDRLFNSAKILNLHMFISREKIIAETLKTLKASQINRAYIRIIITRGETEINLDPNVSFKNNFIIIVKPQAPYPEHLYRKGLYLHIPQTKRMGKEAVNPNAKSGNYLNNVLAINEAKKFGADDAIMENHKGDITEGTSFNIWMVKNGKVYTPPVESGLLKGITRMKVIAICKKNNIPLAIETFTSKEIYDADEVFITSSTKGLMPVYKIDDVKLSDTPEKRPMTQHLSSLYKNLIKEEGTNPAFRYL